MPRRFPFPFSASLLKKQALALLLAAIFVLDCLPVFLSTVVYLYEFFFPFEAA